VRRLLGITFQNPGLDLHLTVEENLRHHGHLYGVRGAELARRMEEEMERFAVADRRRERAAALSGGLRRRVELAKALLSRPRVLLLDEPSTGLDPRARRDLGDALAALTAGGTSVLLTTHFIEEAERCHRLLLLDAGRVVAEGAPDELTRQVGGEVVTLATDAPAALLPDLADVLLEIGAETGVTFAAPRLAAAGSSGGGVRFELTRGGAGSSREATAWETVGRLARRLPGWEQRVTAVTVARPNLEDVFLHHTGHGLHEDGVRGDGDEGEPDGGEVPDATATAPEARS
jgi:ABC-2 type transport system ATP-binding protein